MYLFQGLTSLIDGVGHDFKLVKSRESLFSLNLTKLLRLSLGVRSSLVRLMAGRGARGQDQHEAKTRNEETLWCCSHGLFVSLRISGVMCHSRLFGGVTLSSWGLGSALSCGVKS